MRAVLAGDQNAGGRRFCRQVRKHRFDMVQIPENIGMIELHAGHDRDKRIIMHEFGPFVEKGCIVFIAFNHQVVSLPDPEPGLVIL